MSLERQRKDIQTDFTARFPLLEPSVNITYENVEYIPPTNEPWVRLSFQIIDQYKPCLNNDRLRTDAFFIVQAFTPTAQGANDCSRILDNSVKNCLTAKISNIEFLSYEIDNTGVEGGWFQMVLRVLYRAEDE